MKQYVKSPKGYYYKILQNGTKKRISKEIYLKKYSMNGGVLEIDKNIEAEKKLINNPATDVSESLRNGLILIHFLEVTYDKPNSVTVKSNNPSQIEKNRNIYMNQHYSYSYKNEDKIKEYFNSINAPIPDLSIKYSLNDLFLNYLSSSYNLPESNSIKYANHILKLLKKRGFRAITFMNEIFMFYKDPKLLISLEFTKEELKKEYFRKNEINYIFSNKRWITENNNPYNDRNNITIYNFKPIIMNKNYE